MDLKEQGLIKGRIIDHWNYRAKLAALRRLLAGHPATALLDVGSGSAVFARALLADGDVTAATCVDPGYAADSDETLDGRALRLRRRIGESDAGLVLLMDVLEHVPDDVGLLADYVAKLRSGATLVITVPAFQWMWSEHDEFLEHYRRYTLGQIEAVARQAGLRVERGCYFYGLLLPLAALSRLAARRKPRGDRPPQSQMRSFPPWLNALFGLVCRFELLFLPFNRLAGLSAFVVARKP